MRRPVEDKAVRGPPPATKDTAPRCWRCGRMLARAVTRPWAIRCQKCHAENGSEPA